MSDGTGRRLLLELLSDGGTGRLNLYELLDVVTSALVLGLPPDASPPLDLLLPPHDAEVCAADEFPKRLGSLFVLVSSNLGPSCVWDVYLPRTVLRLEFLNRIANMSLSSPTGRHVSYQYPPT